VVIASGHHTIAHNRRPLCLACLAQRPDAPLFGQRKVGRLAAGLTAAELAARSGAPAHAIRAVERGGWWPRWERLARLVRALGRGPGRGRTPPVSTEGGPSAGSRRAIGPHA
jgi:hypothetical protein